MEISHAKAREVWGQLQSAKSRLVNLRKQGEESIGRTKQLAEGLVGAGVAGFLAGRNGGVMPQLFGFDLDLVVGVAGGLGAIVGVAGKYDEDLLNVSIGFGGGYMYREGMMLGAKHAAASQAAGALPGGQYSGALPGGQYAGAVPGGQYAGAVPGGAFR